MCYRISRSRILTNKNYFSSHEEKRSLYTVLSNRLKFSVFQILNTFFKLSKTKSLLSKNTIVPGIRKYFGKNNVGKIVITSEKSSWVFISKKCVCRENALLWKRNWKNVIQSLNSSNFSVKKHVSTTVNKEIIYYEWLVE